MLKKTIHDALVKTPEILDESQLADLYNEMDMLSETLEHENTEPERRLSSFHFTEFEPPLFMPEAIQRYREAMLPLSEISIGIDISALGTSVQAEVICSSGNTRISFEIGENEDGGGYTIKKRGGSSDADIPCSTEDIVKMVTELALSPEHRSILRNKTPSDEQKIPIDLNDHAIALLIIAGLERHAQRSSQSTYYSLDPESDELPSVTFVASKSGSDKLFRANVSATGEDGPFTSYSDTGIEIRKCSSLDSLEVEYPFKIESDRRIHDTESGKTFVSDNASDSGHIEYVLEIIKRENKKIDKSPPVDPMKMGSIIHLTNNQADLS